MDASKVVRRKISLFAILSKREVDKIFNLVSDEVKRKTTRSGTRAGRGAEEDRAQAERRVGRHRLERRGEKKEGGEGRVSRELAIVTTTSSKTRPSYIRSPPIDDHIETVVTPRLIPGPAPYAIDPALLAHAQGHDPWLAYASASSDYLIRKYHLQPFCTVESARSIGMHAFDNTGGQQRTPLETQDASCCFPAKTTGLASLCVQLTALVISVLITIFFFYQIGGLDEIGITNNSSTILIEDETGMAPVDTTIKLLKSLDDAENDTDYHHYDFHAPFRNATLVVPGIFESDAYELIGLSTLIYLILAALWMFSLVLLLISIKVETLELVVANGFVALVASLYLVVHAIFLILLVVYKFPPPLAFRPSLIIFGSAAIQLVCTLLTMFAMYLLFGWFKYIVYVNSGERCLCISKLRGCCTKKKRNPTQEYAMPEVTAPREIPMDRDFSNF